MSNVLASSPDIQLECSFLWCTIVVLAYLIFVMNDRPSPSLILYIATSRDGFIADADGGVDWLPHPEASDRDDPYGYKALMERISTILMGSISYEQILGFGDWAWKAKQTFVFSSRCLTPVHDSIRIVREDLVDFVRDLKRDAQGHIWLLGGAALVKSLDQVGLIDELIVTLIPKELGDGIALDIDYSGFELKEEKTCGEGIVQRLWERSLRK